VAKLFSFRFDVDTHRCVHVGMPALSELGRRLDAPFTFFVNMGRAVSIPTVVRGWGAANRAVANGAKPRTAAKLSAREKLGWPGYLKAAVVNPRVGATAIDVIRSAAADGHEIGLHGGTNHQVWQSEAIRWSPERLSEEIDAVLPALSESLGGTPPLGFASPGWSTSDSLPELLAARGFRYLADLHGPEAGGLRGPEAGGLDGNRERGDGAPAPGRTVSPGATLSSGATPSPRAALTDVRTQLTGEPGGVAYLEHLRAVGLDDEAVLGRFRGDLERAGPHVVAYDHPYFAGIRDLDMVRRLVEAARDEGYRVVPMAELSEVVAS